MNTSRKVNRWLLLVCSVIVVVALATERTSAAPAIESGGVFSRLSRRVQKSTPSTVAPLKDTRPSKAIGRLFKSRTATTPTAALTTAAPGKGSKTLEHVESIRQRLDETVQKVRARSKEFQMGQEQKRVDRKLRRDQKKVEREAQPSALTASINPHNLKMPECPAGKVYNGRRCVVSSKLTKH